MVLVAEALVIISVGVVVVVTLTSVSIQRRSLSIIAIQTVKCVWSQRIAYLAMVHSTQANHFTNNSYSSLIKAKSYYTSSTKR